VTPQFFADPEALRAYLVQPGDDQVAGWFTELVGPLLEPLLGVRVSTMRTEPSDNNLPALPVRAGECAFAWLAPTATSAFP
jgi:hypothetical protein